MTTITWATLKLTRMSIRMAGGTLRSHSPPADGSALLHGLVAGGTGDRDMSPVLFELRAAVIESRYGPFVGHVTFGAGRSYAVPHELPGVGIVVRVAPGAGSVLARKKVTSAIRLSGVASRTWHRHVSPLERKTGLRRVSYPIESRRTPGTLVMAVRAIARSSATRQVACVHVLVTGRTGFVGRHGIRSRHLGPGKTQLDRRGLGPARSVASDAGSRRVRSFQ